MNPVTSVRRAFGYLLSDGDSLAKRPIKRMSKRLFSNKDGLAIMRILSGPARGSRLALDLAKEASYWVGSYDRRIIKEIVKHCTKGMTAYDCGAYIGYYTAVFASVVGSNGRVVTLEPDPRNFMRVQRQVDLNGWKHVRTLQAALGSGHTTVEFFLNDGSAAKSRIVRCYTGPGTASMHGREDGKSVLVQSVSLDNLIFDMGYPEPDFIKIDIEGAEYMALRHCSRMAREIRPTILVELHNRKCDKAAAAFMEAYSYSGINLKPTGQTTLMMVPEEKSRSSYLTRLSTRCSK